MSYAFSMGTISMRIDSNVIKIDASPGARIPDPLTNFMGFCFKERCTISIRLWMRMIEGYSQAIGLIKQCFERLPFPIDRYEQVSHQLRESFPHVNLS